MTMPRLLLCAGLIGLLTMPLQAAPAGGKDPLAGIVTKKMNYLQFRTALIKAQWTPLVDPACDSNVYGGPGGPKDASNICRQLPELESCSGDGYCSMYFVHKPTRRKVQVVTYGDYTQWKLPGGQSDLAVMSWSPQ